MSGIGESVRAAPGTAIWRDRARSSTDRAADLLARMTLAEKVAQLGSVWAGSDADGEDAAPHQHDLADPSATWDDLIRDGLGHLTRPFGTVPVEPAAGARALAQRQREVAAANRFGIPAIAHDECLAGFTAWRATVYPTPLAWGASFDPDLVRTMAREIGAVMHDVGIHQGLAPVLDVTVDPRWGRTEETIGEDPYLVATLGTAYVEGLQSGGAIATLKHFVGYSASQAARNLAPVNLGPRRLADLLPPFELAVREGGARAVMHSYTEIDGVPVAADADLLTHLLREQWGFGGVVVSDYFGVSFLELLHGVVGSAAEAGTLALRAGIDVELPSTRCYGLPLIEAVAGGAISEEIIDRAARRVLEQKCELGLLDEDWDADAPCMRERREPELDPPASRRTARTLAEHSLVLLANDGTLPLQSPGKLAVVGPLAHDPYAMLGCYTFPSHVGFRYDEGLGVEIPSVLEAIRATLPGTEVHHATGCEVSGEDASGIAAAVELAAASDVCVAVLGDRSGLFGRGTSGEGCDAADLSLPGCQAALLDALVATGTPVVLMLLAGRPYALGHEPGRLAAVIQSFFPGEMGAAALADVLVGAVNPSGRLPVSVPRGPGGQPNVYLTPRLGTRSDVSALDPTPLYPFGHGLSYTDFRWDVPAHTDAPVTVATDGSATVAASVTNVGQRAGTEVVQVYLHDPVAEVTRPVSRLVGYARVELEPAETRTARFTLHADLASFVGRDGRRRVEPGDIEIRLGRSSTDIVSVVRLRLDGALRVLEGDRVMRSSVELS